MLNIVIPMAGAGSRFALAGYENPKPLIPVNGMPMISLVIKNLTPKRPHRFIFICQQKHVETYDLEKKLKEWAPGSIVVRIDGLTDGAARTVLMAKHLIDNSDELMIANSDQYVDIDINDYLGDIERRKLDGAIMTMKADDPKWSFVDLNHEKLVTRVVEKEVISDEATVGIYNFFRGSDFVYAAENMIDQNLRSNNEFYVAPSYNLLISKGLKFGIYNIGQERSGMYGLGIPADLDFFLSEFKLGKIRGAN